MLSNSGCSTTPSKPDPSTPEPLVRVVDRRVVMGVEAIITTWATSESQARIATRTAFARMAALEDSISDYRPRSESMRAIEVVEERVSISREFASALALGERWWHLSGGAFDPTIGPLTALWRNARGEGVQPDSRSIEFAATTVGWEKLRFDDSTTPATVTFRTAAMRLDFGGLGKGLAADMGLEAMREAGLPRTLIDVGGDLVAGSPPPGEDGWRVAVRTVEWDQGLVMTIAEGAVATSGDVEQFIEVEGEDGVVRLGHLLDPRTGRPVLIRREATVFISSGPNSGANADALASLVVVVGMEEAQRLVGDRFVGKVRLVTATVDDADGVHASDWTVESQCFGSPPAVPSIR